MIPKPFRKEYSQVIEGELWHLLNCNYHFADWLEKQNESMWRSMSQYHRARYLVNDRLFTLIELGAGITQFYETVNPPTC